MKFKFHLSQHATIELEDNRQLSKHLALKIFSDFINLKKIQRNFEMTSLILKPTCFNEQ